MSPGERVKKIKVTTVAGQKYDNLNLVSVSCPARFSAYYMMLVTGIRSEICTFGGFFVESLIGGFYCLF